ncbi:hypothetical protein PQX77_002808 [Marasmius sp. AFHP31]|nr:hypothetical protein PQX77_002808 [Marasmius sp. AFHP31]
MHSQGLDSVAANSDGDRLRGPGNIVLRVGFLRKVNNGRKKTVRRRERRRSGGSKSLLKSLEMDFDHSQVRHSSVKEARSQQALPMQPGYTILVADTNTLLSVLFMFSSLVEGPINPHLNPTPASTLSGTSLLPKPKEPPRSHSAPPSLTHAKLKPIVDAESDDNKHPCSQRFYYHADWQLRRTGHQAPAFSHASPCTATYYPSP